MRVVALLTLMLAVTREVTGVDVPRPDLRDAPAPVADVITRAAAAVDASPDNAEAWGDYATVLHAHTCNEEANIAYAEAQRLAPAEFRWAYLRGVLLLNVDASLALECLNIAIGLDAAYGPAYIRRGLALEALGRNDDARRDYLEAVRLQPQNVSAHIHLGQSELKHGNIDAAVRHLERARGSRPNDSTLLSSLARAYSLQGDRTRARQLADAARAGRPSHVVDDRLRNEVGMRSVAAQALL